MRFSSKKSHLTVRRVNRNPVAIFPFVRGGEHWPQIGRFDAADSSQQVPHLFVFDFELAGVSDVLVGATAALSKNCAPGPGPLEGGLGQSHDFGLQK